MADGRLVVGYTSGKVLVVQEDLSLKEVDLRLEGPRSRIDRLVDDRQGQVIGLNWSLTEERGQTFAEVFIINVSSGQFERKLLRSPDLNSLESGELPVVGRKYVGWFGVNVSEDLTRLYRLYRVKKDSQSDLVQVLGKFDVASLEELASNADTQCTSVGMAGYSQYHDVLYSSRLPEGSGVATLLDMDSLRPIVDLEAIVQQEATGRLIVSPFGDGFLLGTSSRVIQVSLSGSVLAEYPLPPEWRTRDYVIVEHRPAVISQPGG